MYLLTLFVKNDTCDCGKLLVHLPPVILYLQCTTVIIGLYTTKARSWTKFEPQDQIRIYCYHCYCNKFGIVVYFGFTFSHDHHCYLCVFILNAAAWSLHMTSQRSYLFNFEALWMNFESWSAKFMCKGLLHLWNLYFAIYLICNKHMLNIMYLVVTLGGVVC